MSQHSVHHDEAAACVLALMVAANGRVDPREMQALWTYPTSTDRYRLETQAGLGCAISAGAGLSTGGVAPATQTPTVVNPCSTLGPWLAASA